VSALSVGCSQIALARMHDTVLSASPRLNPSYDGLTG